VNILIPTLGSRGDVQPYIALAQGLQSAGHRVTLATHPCMSRLVRDHGVPFAAMGPDVDIGAEAARIRGRSKNWMLGFMRTMRFTFTVLEQSHADLLALCRDVDLVITAHSAAGTIEADQLGVPTVSVSLFTQAIPKNDRHAPVVRRMASALAGAVIGTLTARPINRLRRKFGGAPMGKTGITSPLLNLIPISPLVDPPHPLWEARHHVTGYWFAAEPQGWTAEPALVEFLERSEFPVAFSLGAMSLGEAHDTAALAVEAAQRAGVQAVVQGWDSAFADGKLPDSIYRAGSVPHTWLFQRVRAAVHHGGFGTTAAAFRAGTPAVVIPHILDQFYWGKRTHALGCGPEPIPRAKLTAEALAQALAETAQNAVWRERACRLGEGIRAETGVENAVRLIEAFHG
jgi:sterol 3beta-glucosyltransferase